MRKQTLVLGVVLTIGLLGGLRPAAAQTTLTTLPAWNGTDNVSPFGEPHNTTFGQTFTAPSESTLNNFTFYMRPASGGSVNFKAYVMAWDGAKASGPILYESGVYSSTLTPGFTPYTINTGGVSLSTGSRYVAFFSASGLLQGSTNTTSWGLPTSNPYADGEFVFINNGNDFGALSSSNWNQFFSAYDLAFEMNFSSGSPSAVPEPSAALLFLPALGVMAFLKRRQAA